MVAGDNEFKGCVDCLEELDGSLEFREFGFFGQIAEVDGYVDLLKWSSIHWEVNAVGV